MEGTPSFPCGVNKVFPYVRILRTRDWLTSLAVLGHNTAWVWRFRRECLGVALLFGLPPLGLRVMGALSEFPE